MSSMKNAILPVKTVPILWTFALSPYMASSKSLCKSNQCNVTEGASDRTVDETAVMQLRVKSPEKMLQLSAKCTTPCQDAAVTPPQEQRCRDRCDTAYVPGDRCSDWETCHPMSACFCYGTYPDWGETYGGCKYRANGHDYDSCVANCDAPGFSGDVYTTIFGGGPSHSMKTVKEYQSCKAGCGYYDEDQNQELGNLIHAMDSRVRKVGHYSAGTLSRDKYYAATARSIVYDYPGFTFIAELGSCGRYAGVENSGGLLAVFATKPAQYDEGHLLSIRIYNTPFKQGSGAPGVLDEVVSLRRTHVLKMGGTVDYVELGPLSVGQQVHVTLMTESANSMGEAERGEPVELMYLLLNNACKLADIPEPTRSISIVGDSDSVGFATHGCNGEAMRNPGCQANLVVDVCNYEFNRSDNTAAWSFKLGKHLSAETMVTAISGLGVVRNPDPFSHFTMPQKYNFCFTAHQEPKWPCMTDIFKGQTFNEPQAVVILLGGNDFLPRSDCPYVLGMFETCTPEASDKDFIAGYVKFLQDVFTLQSYQPIQVFLVVGGSGFWLDETLYNKLYDLITQVRAAFDSEQTRNLMHIIEIGYPVLQKIKANPEKYVGCMGHWQPAGHDLVVNSVAPKIAEIMKWTYYDTS